MISALMMLMACGGKKAQSESTDAADNDSTVILAQEEMTGLIKELYAAESRNEGGIDQLYACHVWRKMVDAVNEKDSHLAEIGSLNYTEYTYTINGHTICLKPKGVESEDDCYDYDEDTRTLKNEQGTVYYRQVVD